MKGKNLNYINRIIQNEFYCNTTHVRFKLHNNTKKINNKINSKTKQLLLNFMVINVYIVPYTNQFNETYYIRKREKV